MTTDTIPAWTQQDRLRKAREHAGLTQAELADRLGIGRTTVANYENGTTLPKRPVLLSWALATGIRLAWLMHGIEGDLEPDGPDTLGEPSSTWKIVDLKARRALTSNYGPDRRVKVA
jgi:transcriptional regulator with XRE-family HTH domain